jgi:hypothetical protein
MRACDAKNLILAHPLGFKKASSPTALKAGGIYQCRFINYQKRTGIEILDLVEETSKKPKDGTSGGAKNIMTNGGSGTVSTSGGGSASGTSTTAPPDPPPTSVDSTQKSVKMYSRELYKILATDEYLKPLLDCIAKGESKYSSYDAYNCGTSNNAMVTCSDAVRKAWGKPYSYSDGKNDSGASQKISTATIGQLRPMFDIRNKKDAAGNSMRSEGFLTAGRYQFTESAFADGSKVLYKLLAAMKPPIEDDEVFNEKLQDELGAALLMGFKRPRLHGYLLGLNDSIYYATLDLAQEWASIGSPVKNKPGCITAANFPKNPTEEDKDNRCTYDNTYYGGTPNKAFTSVAEVQTALKAARLMMLSVIDDAIVYDEAGRDSMSASAMQAMYLKPSIKILVGLYDENKAKIRKARGLK